MPHKILVIEDENVSMALMKFGLTEQKYEIMTAHNGVEGLEMLRKKKPDLIILDIQMPGMNGYEFMEALNKESSFNRIPVIVITANQTLKDVFRLEGITEYLVKPIKLSDVLALIKKCLESNT